MSLRARLLLPVAAFVLVFSFFWMALSLGQMVDLRADLNLMARYEALGLARRLDEALAPRDGPGTVAAAAAGLAAHPGLTPEQRALAEAAAAAAAAGDAAGARTQLTALRQGLDGAISGTMRTRLDETVNTSGAVGLAGLALALLAVAIAWLLHRSVAGPVGRLLAAAHRLQAGDLAARVEVVGAAELAQLGRAFNAMADAIGRHQGELRTILDALSDGVCVVDSQGRLSYANHSFARLFQLDQRLATGRAWPAACAGRFADPDAALRELERAAAGGGPLDLELAAPAGGSPRCLQISAASVPGLGTLVLHRDVTDQRQLDRLKTQLISTVSHELRTPLASILGFAELLQAGRVRPEELAECAGTIHAEASRLNNLVQHFLDLERLEAGRLELSPAPADLGELLAEAVTPFARTHRHTHPITLQVAAGLPPVVADRERLIQVVQNLVSNAIKYSPGGGPITVAAVRRGGAALLRVSDRGLGIPAQARGKLFQRFYRVPGAERCHIPGSGLGLAICRQIVAAHGGRIGARRRPGGGSAVYVRLPLLLESVGAPP